MRKTVIINVVGVTPRLLGPSTPFLSQWIARGKRAAVTPVLPAVTCSVQATYLTGVTPARHGIVGNGWYFRNECEVKFWRQSNHLVRAPKIWETARAIDASFTCANLFWWYNMYSRVDYAVTPRPMYPADGRKIPDIYTQPADLRDKLNAQLGMFPLFDFWGPRTSIRSSQWIAQAARKVDADYRPTLTLIYLPHLDYNLQRLGPDDPAIEKDLREIDSVCAELIDYYEAREIDVMVVSEYGITPVTQAIALNRVLREYGFIAVREELGLELLDAGASTAFAVADHQIAHVYVNAKDRLADVRTLLERVPGVEAILDEEGKAAHGLNHPRAGDLVALAEKDAWFSYYYWLDDRKAPDFARTVDIHRKPGFDPVELFVDPAIRLPELKVAGRLLKKKLGFRYLLDVIPLDGTLVRGSHGRLPDNPDDAPLVATQQTQLLSASRIEAMDIHDLILAHLSSETQRARRAVS
ncbi:MAG: alkaline phosphatase family protein [Gammaproteobacteria bacterium]